MAFSDASSALGGGLAGVREGLLFESRADIFSSFLGKSLAGGKLGKKGWFGEVSLELAMEKPLF